MREQHAKPECHNKRCGNKVGISIFKYALKLTGLKGAYGLLYFVCAYYVLFDYKSARSAKAYLKRRFPQKGCAGLWFSVYRLFISQGRNLIDRYAMVTGIYHFDLDIVGDHALDGVLASGQGFVLLTSHTGNWQIVMAALKKWEKMVYLLMLPEQNKAMRDAVQVDVENSWVKTISPRQHLGGVVEMMKALAQGHIVCIMGDRTYGADSVSVKFFGDDARLPYSAFKIAAMSKSPVAVMLSAKMNTYQYNMEIADVIYPEITKRGEQQNLLSGWVQRYVDVLERYLQKYPFQYFVFNDLWSKNDEDFIG